MRIKNLVTRNRWKRRHCISHKVDPLATLALAAHSHQSVKLEVTQAHTHTNKYINTFISLCPVFTLAVVASFRNPPPSALYVVAVVVLLFPPLLLFIVWMSDIFLFYFLYLFKYYLCVDAFHPTDATSCYIQCCNTHWTAQQTIALE